MMSRIARLLPVAGLLLATTATPAAYADGLDMSHGEAVKLFWKSEEIYDRNAQTVTLTGGARAVRGDVTVDADTLIGYLRKKAAPQGQPATPPPPTNGQTGEADPMGGSLELYRIEARGHVHIYNQTDQGWGDRALYDMDQAVMVMTGKNLKLTTPQDVLTARDVMEYHSKTRMSVGRGNATVTTNDGRQIKADVLVSFSAPDSPAPAGQTQPAKSDGSPLGGGSSKLDRAYGWGHVVLRTPTQTATGDRGVYVFASQIARLIGHVHVTQGQNQNNGSQAIVNMKTGIATMLPGSDSPIQGLVVPNEANSSQAPK
ncbi:MAG: LptA/OstA family protein [Gluconobacter sp.]|uniref:LptA/OstA family protein n=1 Tax=Gluconobacter sp. TaxID=1876758 RepID=UPI0039EAC773